jgi:hypothetical protein
MTACKDMQVCFADKEVHWYWYRIFLLPQTFADSILKYSSLCSLDVVVDCSPVYMTTHQQDSSQPQQSHDSPHLGAGVGLMMEETEEAMLAGIMMVLLRLLLKK